MLGVMTFSHPKNGDSGSGTNEPWHESGSWTDSCVFDLSNKVPWESSLLSPGLALRNDWSLKSVENPHPMGMFSKLWCCSLAGGCTKAEGGGIPCHDEVGVMFSTAMDVREPNKALPCLMLVLGFGFVRHCTRCEACCGGDGIENLL